MRKIMIEAIKAHAKGHIEKHKMNVEVYLTNPVGVGEHPDIIEAVEKELGTTCSAMSRNQKQRAVAILNDWGAFALRKSVEDVAEALAVSRFTIYNYLERAESAS